MSNKKATKTKGNQQGMVAIFVTLIIMIIISLIVLGFAKLSRREQRAALDKQLSTQAFYAAESGVNDALSIIQAGKVSSDQTDYSSDCNKFINNYKTTGPLDPNVDTQAGVKYTCLLLNFKPNSLDYSDIDTNQSTVIPIESSDPANLVNKITLQWQNKDTTANSLNNLNCPTFNTFTSLDKWNCDVGVLRVDVVPASNLSRTNLENNTYTAFIEPTYKGVGTAGYKTGLGATGEILQGKCDTTTSPLCTIDITVPAADYYLRVRSLYKPSRLHIVGNDGNVGLTGAQVTIDATGQAQDVLRRIQVRKSVFTSSNFPEFAIQTTDSICKRFGVYPGGAVYDGSGVPGAIDTTACDPNKP